MRNEPEKDANDAALRAHFFTHIQHTLFTELPFYLPDPRRADDVAISSSNCERTNVGTDKPLTTHTPHTHAAPLTALQVRYGVKLGLKLEHSLVHRTAVQLYVQFMYYNSIIDYVG
jgi:hypothetical protein